MQQGFPGGVVQALRNARKCLHFGHAKTYRCFCVVVRGGHAGSGANRARRVAGRLQRFARPGQAAGLFQSGAIVVGHSGRKPPNHARRCVARASRQQRQRLGGQRHHVARWLAQLQLRPHQWLPAGVQPVWLPLRPDSHASKAWRSDTGSACKRSTTLANQSSSQ